MYRIGICDDCKADIDKLKQYIQEVSNSSKEILIYEYLAGVLLLQDMHRGHHLLFIDVQMSNMDGNELALEIRKKNKDVLLVFCSGVVQPNTDSFKVQPYRYLMKQFRKKDMHIELKDILEKMIQNAEMPCISVIYDGRFVKVRVDDIIYISIYNKNTKLWITKEASERLRMDQNQKNHQDVFIFQKRLFDVYQKVNKYGFEYPHNSYIVNFKHVTRKEKHVLKLTDGIELNCSRSRERNFTEKFKEYLEFGF